MGTPLNQRVRQLREQRRLTLIEVATACGVTVSFVSDIEHGRRTL